MSAPIPSSNPISEICIPWLQRPYRHPVTGNAVDPLSAEYRALTRQCEDLINFDLLELMELIDTQAPVRSQTTTTTTSPIVSFLSAAFISRYAGQRIHHPYRKQYSAQTTAESNIIENFDFGFIWHKEGNRWVLTPPKGNYPDETGARAAAGIEMVLLIIMEGTLSVNILLFDDKTNSWERFVPLGAGSMQSSELDRALLDYFNRHSPTRTHARTRTRPRTFNYYTPISCPIAPDELDSPQRQLYCSLWSLWFLLFRIKNRGMSRESQYDKAVARALEYPDEFGQFVVDYITFIDQHKTPLIDTAQELLAEGNNIDDYLAEQIFKLF